ncbi:d-2-hydroxyglutarate dehydrogenase, mitochondrial [Trichonephila inaurata madagascariensis]|uniref:D-2-hydroxyglutarate dehydrogenase, mitochondrial n=1 Tax=Trichonephila inaurata madagascariensis TaxID=2747483 RepID=A0A8X7CE62_9ARAC|nr:d-2-hydroxyglutarate dehydrogenase, mitochondrial [Trichonephila inaurata madagascariensis]
MLLKKFSFSLRHFATIFTYSSIPKHGLLCYHKIHKSKLSSVARGKFNTLTSKDIEFFSSLLGSSGIIQNVEELDSYNVDWMKSHKGKSSLALRPRTTEEVSEILKYCNKQILAVCPQGGNTGLVGGSIPIFDEIIVSTSLMNKVIHFDDNTGVLQCQSGSILETLENFANEKGYTVPVDLGAKGSCHIGGNISTNAGGLRFIRYGSLHGNILGLKVVLPNGEILDCMNTMRKNNTGYDLKHMFIGSEGTLGIVTEAAILCYPKSTETAVAFLGCNTFQDVLSTAKMVRQMLPELLSSLEMLDNQSADTLRDNLKLTVPIATHPFYVLVEISGTDAQYNEQKLNECLSLLMEKNHISDGTIATEPSRIKAIWSIRERITEALLKEGHGYKYDISLQLSDFYKIVEVMRERLGQKVTRCVAYGHLGDGNLHFNATSRTFDPEVLALIEPFIYEWTSERKGSISAEHGIGYKKRDYLHYNKTNEAINLMKSMKALIDPQGILNPYKVLP